MSGRVSIMRVETIPLRLPRGVAQWQQWLLRHEDGHWEYIKTPGRT
jgi:hypothetical protein